MIPWLPALWILFQGADTAITTPWHVYADYIVVFRVKYFSFTYQSRPPFGRIAIGGQGMKDPDHIALGAVHFSQGSIGEVVAGQGLATFEHERLFVME